MSLTSVDLPKAEINLETLGLLFAVTFPGFLSMRVYRLIMPAGDVDWKDGLLGAMFYTVLNDVALFPFTLFVLDAANIDASFGRYWLSLVIVGLVGPTAWPIFWVYIATKSRLKRWLIIPFQTAFDYFFSRRITCFVVVHLKDGRMIGGWYGQGSYATTYPASGDLYLSAAVRVDEKGELIAAVPSSVGVLVRCSEYTHLEFYSAQPVVTEPEPNRTVVPSPREVLHE
jgi:Family of unknown function (DUF6338)